MNKFLAGVAALVLTAGQAFAWSPKEIDHHINQTNFVLGDHCTATLIDKEERLILTNHHCITKYLSKEKEEVVDEDGEVVEIVKKTLEDVPITQNTYDGFVKLGTVTYLTDIQKYSHKGDMALLQVKDTLFTRMEEAKLSDELAIRGEKVYVVGNPLGIFDATVTTGIVSSVSRFFDKEYYQTDAGIVGGNSGGAMYNDKGEMIGMPTAAVRGTHLGFSIPSTKIIEFIRSSKFSHILDE